MIHCAYVYLIFANYFHFYRSMNMMVVSNHVPFISILLSLPHIYGYGSKPYTAGEHQNSWFCGCSSPYKWYF